MSDRTHYPPGDCVGCGQHAATMPLCTDCRAVWETDGESWDNKDTHSEHIRQLATAWTRGYNREWAKLPKRPELEPIQ